MSKSEHQKLKLLYLTELLQRETDDTHSLTVQEMIEKLAARGVQAERKSLYNDLNELEHYGMDLVKTRDKTTRYALAHRTFELPELKLLVDAVQSSKFLSERKSRELISKLESLASRYEARALQRQVYVANRVKSMNESIYYSIDTLHAAISEDRQITFRYFAWTVEKTMAFRHEGAQYCVSPYALVRDDENYYCVGYDEAAQQIRHYRVDKMNRIAIAPLPRAGKALFENFDLSAHAKSTFGMFGGEPQAVELLFANRLANVIVDRFGRDVTMFAVNDTQFKVCVHTVISPMFLGWLAGFGAEAKLLSPASAAREFATLCRDAAAQYEEL